MRVYLICPVRNAAPDILAEIHRYVQSLEAEGHEVHFPPRDVDQEDPTGEGICVHHLSAMRLAEEVHVWWDKASAGSHFDLGMAWALGKRVAHIRLMSEDGPGKSYAKVMATMDGRDYAPHPEMIAFSSRGATRLAGSASLSAA